MFVRAINKVKTSIFPIFFKSQQGSRNTIGVLGTGFFINNKGLFMTADHVITSAPANAKILYAGNVPHQIIQPFEPIEVYRDSVKDVFIGRIESDYSSGVNLAKSKPKTGSLICLCGYPMARITVNQDNHIDVSQVRQYWQPTYVIDGFSGNVNQKQYDGFMTQHISLAGMSGGPVFDRKGVVYGMDVATFSRPIKTQSVVVNNGIVIGVDKLHEIISEAKRKI